MGGGKEKHCQIFDGQSLFLSGFFGRYLKLRSPCLVAFPFFPAGNSRGMLCGKTCKEDRDDEWMGVSLARQPKADGSVLVSPCYSLISLKM